MKIIVYLLGCLAISSPALGQSNRSVLTRDIMFTPAAMKELRFPPKAFNQGKSVRVHVRFTVTPKGEYNNVAIANAAPIDESFQEEIDRFWTRLPKPSSTYAGHYVIPINFLFGDRSPDKLKSISNETDTISGSQDYKVLSDLLVVAYMLCEKKSFNE